MSKRKDRELDSWKAVLVHLGRIETTWRGNVLSSLDHATFIEAVLMNAMVLNDLSNRYFGCGCFRDHVLWAHNCARTDVDRLASFLSAAILLLRDLSSDTSRPEIRGYADFKRQLSDEFPFAGALLSPIRDAIDLYIADRTPHSFTPAYQFLAFLTHLTLTDIDMSEELERGYMEEEERVAQHHLPDQFVAEMNSVMRDWFRDFKIESEDFVPKHGPGSVAELTNDTSLLSKYRLLSPDAMIRYVFRKFAGLDVSSYVPFESAVTTVRQSAIVFVPKSMKTKRVISKEPATLMYFQKGVERAMKSYISQHKVLRTHIDFGRQELQRSAALEASRTRAFATVDLSAASDSVSFDLVKRVFRGTPLYPYLVALRSSSTVLPSGKVQGMAKFAPMGSALCFPVETAIFACIAECTARYVTYREGSEMASYRVYGDDIIVREQCLTDLVVNLQWCGFRINRSKTYGGDHRFRESCGCDAYDGTDVTPMKIGRRFSSRRIGVRTPGVFEGLCSMANDAYEHEFLLLRRYLVDKLIHGSKFVPLFSEDTDHGVYSPTPTNFGVPRKRHADLERRKRRKTPRLAQDWQCWMVQVARPRTVVSQLGSLCWDNQSDTYSESGALPMAEEIRYFEWLRITCKRDGDPHDPASCPRVDVGNAVSYLSRQWVSDPL